MTQPSNREMLLELAERLDEVVDYIADDLVAMHSNGATGLWDLKAGREDDPKVVRAILDECASALRAKRAAIIYAALRAHSTLSTGDEK